MKRGILGLRSDPKKPTLFSFTVKPGMECLSDSDDSDYKPRVSDSNYSNHTSDESTCAAEEKSNMCNKRKRLNLKVIKAKKLSKVSKQQVIAKTDGGQSDSDSTVVMSDYEQDVTDSRQKVNTRQEVKSLSVRSNADVSDLSRNSVDLWGQRVPEIILLKIFSEVIRQDGALPFLSRVASRICCLWNRVSEDPILWKNVDLSYGWIKKKPETLDMLCDTRFSFLEVLNLSGWKTLSGDDLLRVTTAAPRLTSIDLEGCRITPSKLTTIIDNAPNIVSFDLSGTSAVSNASMTYLFNNRGAKLKSLIINDCRKPGCKDLLKLIASKCPQLEALSLCNRVRDSLELNFPIEKMQAGCAKLKTLRFINTVFVVNNASVQEQIQSPGFPCLEELCISAYARCSESFAVLPVIVNSSNFLHRMLKKSVKLKSLDLRWIQNISCDSLQSLNIPNLQHLYVASSSVAKNEGLEVIMSKWQHSLVDLDLSWNIYPDMILDEAMNNLSNLSELRSLDLRGTQISVAAVKSLLNGCPRLERLMLDSCRSLPRGMKKEYSGAKLKALLRDINRLAPA